MTENILKKDKFSFIFREMTLEDIPGVMDLQVKVFTEKPGWSVEQLKNHLKLFPEGQLVALDNNGHIVGSSSSLLIDWDDYSQSANWTTVTAKGTFNTHNPHGTTLYGADMCVDPSCQGCGIGSQFYEMRKKMIKERGLKRLLTGGRIPGYSKVADQMTVEEYISKVISGKLEDPTLTFQLKNGFVVLDIIPEYLRDSESGGYATLLEWLNPEYVMNISLAAAEELSILEKGEKELAQEKIQVHRVRIASLQYLLRPINSFDEFAKQVEFFVHSAEDYHCHFILFPEYFTMQLLSYMNEQAPGRAVRKLAQLTIDYEDLFTRLATQYKIYIIAGTHPIVQQGKLFNAAHLFTPHGRIFIQKKVHLTNAEKGPYQMSRGHGFYVFHTDYGKIAILVCYDVEFPEASRLLAEAGVQIIFVPSCTDERQAFFRVRYCSHARAIENQIYMVVASTVGNLPYVPCMATNYGQAAILTPSDYFFARDGVAAEGVFNHEQMVITDVDLDLLAEQRVNGTVIPLQDLIHDAYDHAIHYKDI